MDTKTTRNAWQTGILHPMNVAAEHQSRLIRSLLSVSSELLATTDTEILLQKILHQLRELVEYHTAAIHMVEGEWLRTCAGVGDAIRTVGQTNFHTEQDYVWQYVVEHHTAYVTGNVSAEPWQPLAGFDKICSFMAVPMVAQTNLIGILTIDHVETDAYDSSDVEVVRIFANHAAIALENARHFTENRRYIRELEALHGVRDHGVRDLAVSDTGLSSTDQQLLLAEKMRSRQLALLHNITTTALQTDDMQEMIKTLADQLGLLINADGCYISLWDRALQMPIPTAASGELQAIFKDSIVRPEDKTLTSQVLTLGHPLVIEDAYNSPLLSRRIAERFPAISLLALPLQVGQEKIGAALLAFNQPHRFTDEEIAIGEQAAVQASVAISKARLLQIERRQRKFTETQLKFSYRLINTATQEEAVQALLDTISEVVQYDTGSVILLDPTAPDTGAVSAVNGYTDPAEALHRTLKLPEYPLLEKLRLQKEPVYFPEIRGEERWRPGHQMDPKEVRSILLAPLHYRQGSEVLGCLTLKSYRPNALTLEDRNNILLLCNQTAGALHSLQLFQETNQRLNDVTMLAHLSERLNRTLELDEILRFVLDQVVQILEKQSSGNPLRAGIILRQQPGDGLQLAVSHQIEEEDRAFFNQRQFTVHDATFMEPFLQGKWLEIDDPQELQSRIPVHSPNMDMTKLLHIPMEVDDEIVGIISANRTVKDEASRQLLSTIARLAGAAILKIQLLSQARTQAVELMEAYDTLHQMDRERDEFIQNVTHDLRAPLTFIRGYAELMAEGELGDISPDQQEALQIIQERTDAVSLLVTDILQVKQIEAQPLKEEPVFIETIAHAAVRSALASAKEAAQEIILDIESDRNRVLGDAQRLGQVFDNLLSNAIKYSGDSAGQIHVQIQRRGTKVLVSVADQGIGIPEGELDKIWDRYYRVSGSAQNVSGTGLGLANVRRIVEAHGGQIWVESGESGTTFTFELPLHRPQ